MARETGASYGKALRILRELEPGKDYGPGESDEILNAIHTICEMTTINAMTKDMLLNVVKYLCNYRECE